ncbi:hypothetical protein [Helicobacter valdiviensis]|nr:hypothetical protein [Helicobacter valdiviensis]
MILLCLMIECIAITLLNEFKHLLNTIKKHIIIMFLQEKQKATNG